MLAAGSDAGHRLWLPDPAMGALLDSIPSALAVLDPHGHIVYRNAAWTALGSRTSAYGDLGTLVTAADREGTPYLRRLANLDGPLALPAHRLARAAQDALAGRNHESRLSYRIRRPDGEEPFEAVLVPLPTPKATLLAIQHIDVADRERAADAEAVALEKGLALEDAQARERRLTRRMVALGRDLHTPITPVRLELHLLRSGAFGQLTPAQAKAVDVAHRNVGRWADREDDFQGLPLAPSAPPESFDLAAFILEVVETHQTAALQQGVRLVVSPAKPAALPVLASKDDVRDVLDRFLSHALAASPADSTVTVELEGNGDAKVSVIDSGPGLSARELRMAFDPWGGRRPTAGASLSLHMAKLQVEKAGGRAWAESDGPGQGLLLGFSLPLLTGGGFAAVPAARATSAFAAAAK